jgi:glyoxylase-like metal-dependent hydrolase (beta-lactamase superfamily II)
MARRAINAVRGGLSRRTLLGGGLGALAALTPRGPVRASNGPAFHKTRIGTIELTVVSDGAFSLPLGFVLPKTPGDAIAALLGSDAASGAIQPAVNAVVVRAGESTVLIDCGGGTNFLAGLGKLPESLEAAGVAPETISSVIFTHAHPDHLWGVWDDFEGASRFAKASHIVSAAEWDFWTDRTTIDKTPEQMRGMAAGNARILKALEKTVRRVSPGDSVAPGLTLIATPGHTPGHVAVLIESGGQNLLVGGDVFGHARVSFERPDWVWGADQDSDRAIATRKRLLDMLATDRIGLLGYHLPWPGLGRVERQGAAYRYIAN